MADEFDLIEARISVKIKDGDLKAVKEQLDNLVKRLDESAKIGIGVQIVDKVKFQQAFNAWVKGLPKKSIGIAPKVEGKGAFQEDLRNTIKKEAGKTVEVKVTANTKEADKAIAKTVRGARAAGKAGSRSTGTVEYLQRQVERWGQINGRLAKSRELLNDISSNPNFGSRRDFEDIRAEMSYFDRIQNEQFNISELDAKLEDWGKLPGRVAESQRLLAKVRAEGFGARKDFSEVARDMRKLDVSLDTQARKSQATKYAEEWGKVSGQVEKTKEFVDQIGRSETFTKKDFDWIRNMTKQLDNAAASQAAVMSGLDRVKVKAQKVVDPEKERRARAGRRAAAVRGALFEAGFVAGPAVAVAGNVAGIFNQVRKFSENSDYAADAAKKLGIGIGTLGKIAGGAAGAISIVGGAVFQLGKVAFSAISEVNMRLIGGLKEGFQAVIGPALALFNAIRSIASYLPILAAGVAGFLGETLTQATIEFDKIKSLFDFTFASEARSQLQLVREVSDSFGLSLDALATGYGKLAASAKGSGVAQEEIRQLFLGTASAAAVFKLTQADLDGVFRAYQQIISKSVVSSEELRQQLSERLPRAFSLAAESLGMTTEKLNEQLSLGALGAERFIPAFGAALRKAFDEQALGVVDSLPAKLNRLQNSLLDLQRSAEGTGFLEAFVDLKQGLIDPFIKDGAIKDAIRNVFVSAGNSLKFFRAQIPIAIDLLKNIATTVAPIVEAFVKLQVIFSTLAIAAAKEFVNIDRNLSGTLGDGVRKIKDFANEASRLLNIDFSKMESVFAFVTAVIKNSDLALAAFLETLNTAVQSLLTFAAALYGAIIPLMVDLGVRMGKAIAEGIGYGLFGDDRVEKLLNERAQILETLRRGQEAGGAAAGPGGPAFSPISAARRAELNAQKNQLTKELLLLQNPNDYKGLFQTFAGNLSAGFSDAISKFAENDVLKEILGRIGIETVKEQAKQFPIPANKTPTQALATTLLPSLRTILSQATTASTGFESQFFGFEEFQRFLQSGTNETVVVAENTKKLVEYSAAQVAALNALKVSSQTLVYLMGSNGVFSTPGGGLGMYED